MIRVFTILLFFVFLCNISLSQSRSELERQRNKLLSDISEAEQILNSVQKNKSESLDMLTLIDKKISSRNNLISNLNKDISKVDQLISELEAQISNLNSDILNLKKEYGRVIWLSYLNRQKINHLMFILSADNFNQAYRRLHYLKQYTEYRKKQIKTIQGVQTNLGNKLVDLDLQKSEKSKLLSKIESENKILNKDLAEKTKMVNILKRKENELRAKIRKNNLVANRLKREIEKIITREIELSKSRASKGASSNASSTNTSKSSNRTSLISELTPDEAFLANNFKENRGKLPWPTERGIITGYFGEKHHPVYKNLVLKNDGIDISTVEGANVRAIFDGEVRVVVPILGANFSVLVRHGNFYTVYSNIVDVQVKAGDKIKTKQSIGRVFTDRTTNSTVLHLEIWDNLKRLDPQLWLNKN